jgi:hypothetical protein
MLTSNLVNATYKFKFIQTLISVSNGSTIQIYWKLLQNKISNHVSILTNHCFPVNFISVREYKSVDQTVRTSYWLRLANPHHFTFRQQWRKTIFYHTFGHLTHIRRKANSPPKSFMNMKFVKLIHSTQCTYNTIKWTFRVDNCEHRNVHWWRVLLLFLYVLIVILGCS